MRKKVDGNQNEIVSGLRQIGATVQSLASIGHGCPDILVGWRGRNILYEIKMPKCKLTHDEHIWNRNWTGEVHVVESLQEAINYLGR